MKRRSLLYLILSIVIISAFFILYDFNDPSCVEAQTCYPVRPRIIYGTTGAETGAGCETTTAVATFPNIVGRPWVGVTGWNAEYTAGNEQITAIAVEVTNVTPIGNQANIDFRVCFHDQSRGDGITYSVQFVAMAWQ